MRAVRMIMATAVVVGFAMAGARWPDIFWSEMSGEGAVVDALGEAFFVPPGALMGSGAAFGLLLLGSWLTGKLAGVVGLPKITGYLLFGVLCGPSVLGVIGKAEMEYLTLVNNLAIALIALTAGGEIKLSFLKRAAGRIAAIGTVQVGLILLCVTGTMVLALPRLTELTFSESPTQLGIVALIVGVLAVANSPAVVIAMIAELRARGEMSQTALAVTICKDLMLVVLFAIVISIAGVVFASGGGDPTSGESGGGASALTLKLVQELGGSLLAGGIAGLGCAWYLRFVRAHLPIFLVFACFGIALGSEVLHLEPLIVALVAGMMMENIWPERSRGFFETVEDLSLPVYCVFFAVAGAKVSLSALASMWHWALLLVAARAGAVVVGTWLGAKWAGMKPPARTWLWSAFIPQAGVALVLATIVSDTFSSYGWSVAVFNLLLAMIATNELIGPLVMKLGLVKTGEVTDGDGGTTEDGDAEPGPDEGDG